MVFGADPVTPDQLPSAFFEPSHSSHAPEPGLLLLPPSLPILSLRELKARTEREYVEAVLQRTRWNVTAAARLLDVQRTYLHQKVRALGTRRPGSGAETDDGEG